MEQIKWQTFLQKVSFLTDDQREIILKVLQWSLHEYSKILFDCFFKFIYDTQRHNKYLFNGSQKHLILNLISQNMDILPLHMAIYRLKNYSAVSHFY